MTLMLHVNAEPIDYDGLRQIVTPEPTLTHIPIPHFRVVDLIKTTLGMYGHVVTAESHGVTQDGMRYFGLISLRSSYTGYEDTVGLRNSHDRSFPVGIGFGSRVFVCDNMAFSADTVIKRRHTVNLKRDLPGIVGELIEPLAIQREAQALKISRYKQTMLTGQQADHGTLELYRKGVINVQRVADVLQEWDQPSFDDLENPTAWRLFNAVTYALRGRVIDNPNSTTKLHQVIDSLCEEVGHA
jgi:hypothetical protein